MTTAVSQHVKRTIDLIKRAVHPGTPLEEARTSAMLAVKNVVTHSLVISDNGQETPPPPPPPPSPPPPPQEPKRSPYSGKPGRWIISKFTSGCVVCDGLIDIGESVWWEKGKGVTCRDCRQQR